MLASASMISDGYLDLDAEPGIVALEVLVFLGRQRLEGHEVRRLAQPLEDAVGRGEFSYQRFT